MWQRRSTPGATRYGFRQSLISRLANRIPIPPLSTADVAYIRRRLRHRSCVPGSKPRIMQNGKWYRYFMKSTATLFLFRLSFLLRAGYSSMNSYNYSAPPSSAPQYGNFNNQGSLWIQGHQG
ncbi:hypothetical protein BDZ91DRAFT_737705 [Kalaharituber pfeilii]|nr:hypothetical protein BDZ91DRAFT_737705 [Kalaharituber pfeilii]